MVSRFLLVTGKEEESRILLWIAKPGILDCIAEHIARTVLDS